MTLAPRQRWLAITLALVVTLVAAQWVSRDPAAEEPVVGPVERSGPRAERPASRPERGTTSTAAIDPERLKRAPAAPASVDLFEGLSWQRRGAAEASRNAPPPPPPPPPQAPPLPYAYLGKLIEGGVVTAFLVDGDRNVIVRAGETLDGRYRVESVDENRIVFTYLPLRQKQELALGDVPAPPGTAAAPGALPRPNVPRAAAQPPAGSEPSDRDD